MPADALVFPHLPTRGAPDSTRNFELLRRVFKEATKWHVVGEDLGKTAFTNSWVNFEANRKAEYSIDGFGYVHLRGVIKGGESGKAAFTLPADYLPKAAKNFIVQAASSTAILEVAETGVVTPSTLGGEVKTSCWLDQVTFSVN